MHSCKIFAQLPTYHRMVGSRGAVALTNQLVVPAATCQVFVLLSLSSSQAYISLVHSHWSRTHIAALSLVEGFPSNACASNLMPERTSSGIQRPLLGSILLAPRWFFIT